MEADMIWHVFQLNDNVNFTMRCTRCMEKEGCMWCPSTCGGQGKCMEGDADGPTYEMCPALSTAEKEELAETSGLSGRSWGVCLNTEEQEMSVGLYLAIVLACIVALILVILIRMWARRRHGGLRMYTRKKLVDLKRWAVRMKIMPPDDARWSEFWVSLVVLALAALLLAGIVSSGSTELQEESIYLDQATVVTIDMDFCTLRFRPARNYPSPDSDLSSPKIVSKLTKDPDITLSTDTCRTQVSITVQNKREPSLKYRNYQCEFEVIVPEGVVLPGMLIKEHALGYPSTVRGGPMDADTPLFGLRFGPNKLMLEGAYMKVRFGNVSAKEVHFNVAEGSILAEDIITTDPTSVSTFETVGADIILTTTRMTSVQVKQDTGNLICLTAANESLFVDDRRQEFCNYIDSNTESGRRRRSSESEQSLEGTSAWPPPPPPPHASSSRGGASRRNHQNFTKPEFGPLEMCPDQVTKKRDVPYVPGCTDMTFCKQSETEQCLCKPICDLVEPEDLCYDGVCGVEGKCDKEGKCCRLITRDFTTADLFPKDQQPRDGAAIDAILYPWQPNNLEQRWRLYSQKGQIAVTALTDIATQYRVSSFRLAQPVGGIMDGLDITVPEDTKALIDKLFHPSGASRPKEVIFEFSTSGPGLAERQQGSIYWILSQVSLDLPPCCHTL